MERKQIWLCVRLFAFFANVLLTELARWIAPNDGLIVARTSHTVAVEAIGSSFGCGSRKERR
jgi:hypothetical protein